MHTENSQDSANRAGAAKLLDESFRRAWNETVEGYAMKRPAMLGAAVVAFLEATNARTRHPDDDVPGDVLRRAVERVWLLGMCSGGQMTAQLATAALVHETSHGLADVRFNATLSDAEISERLNDAMEFQELVRKVVMGVLDPGESPPEEAPAGDVRDIGDTRAEAN